MPSFFKFLRGLIWAKDSSATTFSAGVKAWAKYEKTRELRYLEQAVQNHQAALDARVSGHPGRAESLYHTAMALWAQCELGAVTRETATIVISYYDEALRLLPPVDKAGHRAIIHNNLGLVYFRLFRLGEENPEAFPDIGPNLIKAIENHRSALKLKAERDDPNRPTSLINLSIALIQKDNEADLTHAITYLGEAVELCNAKASDRPSLILALNSLAEAHDGRYYHSGDVTDVVGQVDALRRVLDLLTAEGKGRLIPLLNLTNGLWRLCEQQPDRGDDLEEAVRRGQEALKLSDRSDKITHFNVLITLADVLFTRYTQINQKRVTDLDQAIQYYREAIDPDPGEGRDPVLYSSLASAIYVRCQDFGEVDGVTLEHAFSYNLEALHACPQNDPLYLKIRNDLGSIYLAQHKNSGQEGDLAKGVPSSDDTVAPPPDEQDYAHFTEAFKDAKWIFQDRRGGHSEASDETVSTKSHSRSRAGSVRSLASSVSGRSMARSVSRSSTRQLSLSQPPLPTLK